ncbi:MAG: hypothetical protein ABS897_11455 [Eubacteriales bacterium]
MKKQSIFVLVAVVLLLLAIPCIASAGISNIRCTYQDTGDVLVRWDDTGSGIYEIRQEMSDWTNGRYYYDMSETNYVTLSYLVPGQTYTITVQRGSESASIKYEVPRPMFRDYTSTGRGFLKMTENTFSIGDQKATPNKTFELQVSWPWLKYSRDYAAKVVLKTPLGYTGRVYHYESFTFENKYSYRYLTYMMYPDWLEYVEGDFDAIPTGRYTFEFYVNGALYETIGFTVGR